MKITSIFPYLPKNFLSALVAVVSVLTLSSVVLAGFGPERPTKVYTEGVSGFDYVTFNSFTNVPDIGDERAFFHGKIAGNSGGYYDPMTMVRDGDELLVRVYIHNNASESLNESGEGIARDVNVRINYDEGVVAKSHNPTAYISASNANPTQIYDTLTASAENGGSFELVPVTGSAKITTNDGTQSIDMAKLVSEDGINIGDVKGCFPYVALVTMKFEVKMPQYEIEKSVRFEGETSNDWKQSINAESGDTVEYLVSFTNTGKTTLNSVIIKDDLPEYIDYIPGSTVLYNSNYPGGKALSSDAVVANGINIGNYDPESNAYVLFKAKVDSKKELECNVNRLTNIAFAAAADLGRVSDGADVVVDAGECEEEPEYVYKCTAVNVDILSKADRKIRVSATASGSPSDKVSVLEYAYNFGDGNTKKSTDNKIEHIYAEDGTYNIDVTVKFDVNGDVKSVECGGHVSFTPPELPNTGPGSILATLFGATTVGASVRAWIRSKRNLTSALLA